MEREEEMKSVMIVAPEEFLGTYKSTCLILGINHKGYHSPLRAMLDFGHNPKQFDSLLIYGNQSNCNYGFDLLEELLKQKVHPNTFLVMGESASEIMPILSELEEK